jgi:hypothetical protein
VNFSRLALEQCGPCPVSACYTLAFALKLRKKHGKKNCQGSRKVPVTHDSVCRQGCLLQVARISCRSRSPCFKGPRSTLGQRRYLPSRVTKGFPTSANAESNLRDLMWSVKSFFVTKIDFCLWRFGRSPFKFPRRLFLGAAARITGSGSSEYVRCVISSVSVIRAVIHVVRKSQNGMLCSMMRPVRTIITLILCIYECICYFQACNHVIYECNALYLV